jgi:phosphohistidine swiveling domain-containing protein
VGPAAVVGAQLHIPVTSGTYSSTVNIEEFQYLMYRPLYWFGNGRARR